MTHILRALCKTGLVVMMLAVLIACAQGQNQVQPSVFLIDTSFSSSTPAARLATRRNLATLLGEAPSGAPFLLIGYNRVPRILYAGRVSTKSCTAALAAADGATIGGPTDLGKALEFAAEQPMLEGHSFDVVVISDFQVDAPAASPWSGKSLVSILEQFHKRSVRRFLLIPVGTAAGLQGIPAYAETLQQGQDPERWLKDLLPPPPPPKVPVVKPFWTTRPVLLSVGIVLVLVLRGGISFAGFLKQRRDKRLLTLLRAEPLANDDDHEEESQPPVRIPAAPDRCFEAMLLESGVESPIGARTILVGKSPLSNIFLHDGFTTLAMRKVGNGSSLALSIRNAGERPVYVGSFRIQPNKAVLVPWGQRIDCQISPDQTLRVVSSAEVANDQK